MPAVDIGPGPGPGPGGSFYHFNLLLMLSYIVNTETEGAQGSGNINSGPAVVRRPSSLAEIFIFDVLISDLAASSHQTSQTHTHTVATDTTNCL